MKKPGAPVLDQRQSGRGKRGKRGQPLATWGALYVALILALLLVDAICSRAALSVIITRDARGVTIQAGSVTRHFATSARLLGVTLPPRDPTAHEYQMDGTDSANNFTLDSAYFHRIAGSAYYRFSAWMRGLDDLSRWRDLCVAADSAPARCSAAPPIASGESLAIPDGGRQRVSVALQQPETPVTLDLSLADGSALSLLIDPNDHFISVTPYGFAPPSPAATTTFYPSDPGDIWPLAAQTLDLLARVLLWALALLGAVWAIEAALGWALAVRGMRAQIPWPLPSRREPQSQPAHTDFATGRPFREPRTPKGASLLSPLATNSSARHIAIAARAAWARLSAAIHPIGLALIGASFAATVWIALVQYHAQPHIYDASAYLFQARVFASGRLYAPAPSAPAQFPGPFMALAGKRWFSQYEPGTSATLALGVLVGAPWLVEPVLGALTLLGMGLTLRRLYDRRVATLAVALGAVSPFYLWLSASYLSHTIALFYLIWGFWAMTRFAQGGRGWNLPVAAALWGLGMLTRDTSALFVAAAMGGLAWLAWRGRWPALYRRHWAPPLVWTAVAAGAYLTVYLDYNVLLTGQPLLTPRALLAPFDHWGFGQGVGFYGAHTLAAGFITVQALLTSLSISLFGWPFYLTLAFLPLPFLARRTHPADAVLLGGALLMTAAFLGFYYHGVYLGPRYLFEALPFYLGLTARGIITLFEVGQAARAALSPRPAEPGGQGVRPLPPLAAPALLAVLAACAALYYFPRQVALHANFSGMDANTHIQTAALAHPPIHHAIVITDNNQLYGYTLCGLNDPSLSGDVLYAYATGGADYLALRRAYPDRTLYLLTFDAHGQPRFLPLSG
ncbi:MAG TPA: glycosyltransferase family 39 protein [Ktedonobacterales bacterium]